MQHNLVIIPSSFLSVFLSEEVASRLPVTEAGGDPLNALDGPVGDASADGGVAPLPAVPVLVLVPGLAPPDLPLAVPELPEACFCNSVRSVISSSGLIPRPATKPQRA